MKEMTKLVALILSLYETSAIFTWHWNLFWMSPALQARSMLTKYKWQGGFTSL